MDYATIIAAIAGLIGTIASQFGKSVDEVAEDLKKAPHLDSPGKTAAVLDTIEAALPKAK